MHRVLAGTTADLEDASAIGEKCAQQRKDRLAIAFAGGGEGQVIHSRIVALTPRRLKQQRSDARVENTTGSTHLLHVQDI